MTNEAIEITDADYENIWGTIEETAKELDGKIITAGEQSPVEVVHVSESSSFDETMSADPGPAPEELPKSPLSGAAGAHVYRKPKDPEGAYPVYSLEHDFNLYTFYSDGMCYVDHEDGRQDNFSYLNENDPRLPVDQAVIFAANLRLGINNGFRIDTFQKLDWYHSKRVMVEEEIETVKAAMKAHLTLLENDLKRLSRMEDEAAEFAQGLLKGKTKSVKMTHGTISFTDRKTSAVLDNSEDAPVIREQHVKALFKDKGSREKYNVSVEVKATYKQDSALIAKEELAHYENYLKSIENLEPDENGEVNVPEYKPLHPGWMIKPASRTPYFKGPKGGK